MNLLLGILAEHHFMVVFNLILIFVNVGGWIIDKDEKLVLERAPTRTYGPYHIMRIKWVLWDMFIESVEVTTKYQYIQMNAETGHEKCLEHICIETCHLHYYTMFNQYQRRQIISYPMALANRFVQQLNPKVVGQLSG